MAVAARLAVIGGSPAAIELFVADLPGRGHGQLIDALAAQIGTDAGFLPVRTAGRVQLVAKHAIAWIAVPRRAAEAADAVEAAPPVLELATELSEELTLYDHQYFVEVELADRTKLIGTLLDSAPAGHSRAIDHLNRAGRLLRLWTTDEHYLVNTRQIVTVTELGEVW